MRISAIRTAAAVSFVGLAFVSLPTLATASPSTPDPSTAIRYVVTANSASSATGLASGVAEHGGHVDNVYSTVITGFAATMTPTQVKSLRSEAGVQSVVPDVAVHTTSTELNPTWGLDRIDQHSTAGNKSYRYSTTGLGVTAYVVDTGVLTTHSQFGGRAHSGYDFVGRDTDAADCNGHGTHVAGTIGGSTYGVAKGVKLVAVRVLACDGSGWASDVIDGLDWVAAHKGSGPAVVNLSLGTPAYIPLDDAVSRTIAAGITVVVAAGNDDQNACSASPARVPAAITVAASDIQDRRASFSNYGSCVDVFAPGVAVESSWFTSSSASEYLSGTSMATPHVVGVVARYLQSHPTSTPAQTATAVLGSATTNTVVDTQGSPNRLLYAAGPAVAPGQATKVVASKSNKARTGTLRWSAPSSNGGTAIRSYRVSRNGKNTKGVGATTLTVSARTKSYTFTKLKKGSKYTFSVRAVNAVGAGKAVSKTISKLK